MKKFFLGGFFPRGVWKSPYYDDRADYDTNAKSYFDWMARWNGFVKYLEEAINKLLRRNIKTDNTNSVELIKEGDWIDNGSGDCDPTNDVITLKANVITSNETENFTTNTGESEVHTLSNGTVIKDDGVWSPDTRAVLSYLANEIKIVREAVESISGGNWQRLVKDVDYIVTFYNGFKTPSMDIGVQVQEIFDDYNLSFFTNSAENLQLQNDDLFAVRMRHTENAVDTTTSWIFTIEFIGEWAHLGEKSIIEKSSSSTGIWNLRPRPTGTQWPSTWFGRTLITKNSRTEGKFLVTLLSYADGRNTQFSLAYSDYDSLSSELINNENNAFLY